MFEHNEIWNAIDRLAESSGLSTSGLAKKAGLDPTTFNKSKRYSPEGKPRWPSTESLSKILAISGATMSDFMALVDKQGFDTQPRDRQNISTLPMIGWAQAGAEGFFDENGYPVGEGWDDIPFPFLYQENETQLYALEINGESMLPLYRPGDILIIAPGAQIRRGDKVVVKTRQGEVMAKELARQTTSRIELKSFNPAFENRILEMEEIEWIARIFWVSQ